MTAWESSRSPTAAPGRCHREFRDGNREFPPGTGNSVPRTRISRPLFPLQAWISGLGMGLVGEGKGEFRPWGSWEGGSGGKIGEFFGPRRNLGKGSFRLKKIEGRRESLVPKFRERGVSGPRVQGERVSGPKIQWEGDSGPTIQREGKFQPRNSGKGEFWGHFPKIPCFSPSEAFPQRFLARKSFPSLVSFCLFQNFSSSEPFPTRSGPYTDFFGGMKHPEFPVHPQEPLCASFGADSAATPPVSRFSRFSRCFPPGILPQ